MNLGEVTKGMIEVEESIKGEILGPEASNPYFCSHILLFPHLQVGSSVDIPEGPRDGDACGSLGRQDPGSAGVWGPTGPLLSLPLPLNSGLVLNSLHLLHHWPAPSGSARGTKASFSPEPI